jgi:hypothetical protein
MRLAVASALVLGSAVYADASAQHSGMQREKGQSSGEGSGERQKITGTVKKAKPVGLRHKDQDNLLVQLETDKGRRRVVDLGDAKRLELDIKNGDKITAWGRMMNFGGKDVFVARKLEAHGQKVSIDHPDLSREESDRRETARKGGGKESQPYSGQGHIKGEVVAVGQVTEYERAGNVLAFDRDHFYIVEEPDGRQSHVIVADDMDQRFAVGDQIQARVRPDGTVTSISRASDRAQRDDQRSREETAQFRQSEEGY